MQLDPDIDIRHLSGPQWVGLLELFGAAPSEQKKSPRPRLLRLTHRGQLVKLWHSERGLLPRSEELAALSPRELSQRFDRARVFALSTEALTDWTSRWQQGLDPRADFFDQVFGLLNLLGSVPDIDIHPPLGWMNVPTVIRSSLFRLVLPRGRLAVFLVTRDDKIYSSLIIRNGARGFDLMTTSEAFYEHLPERADPSLIGPLCELAAKRYGAVHGAFGIDWQAFWNLRRNVTSDYVRELEKSGQLLRPHWPMAWNVLLWTAERKHWKKTQKLDPERRASATRPLSRKELHDLL